MYYDWHLSRYEWSWHSPVTSSLCVNFYDLLGRIVVEWFRVVFSIVSNSEFVVPTWLATQISRLGCQAQLKPRLPSYLTHNFLVGEVWIHAFLPRTFVQTEWHRPGWNSNSAFSADSHFATHGSFTRDKQAARITRTKIYSINRLLWQWFNLEFQAAWQEEQKATILYSFLECS